MKCYDDDDDDDDEKYHVHTSPSKKYAIQYIVLKILFALLKLYGRMDT